MFQPADSNKDGLEIAMLVSPQGCIDRPVGQDQRKRPGVTKYMTVVRPPPRPEGSCDNFYDYLHEIERSLPTSGILKPPRSVYTMHREETKKDDPYGISEPGSGDHFIDLDDYEELHRALKAGDYSYHSRSGYKFIADYFKVGRFLLCATGDFDQHYMICNHNKPGHMIYNTWLPVTCGKLREVEEELEASKAESAKEAEGAACRKKYEPSPVVAPLPNPPKKNCKCEPGDGMVWVYLATILIGLLIAANS